eukprot:13048079-Alexandrium_andersonii.AAC.1
MAQADKDREVAALAAKRNVSENQILHWQIAAQTISWARVQERAPNIMLTNPLFKRCRNRWVQAAFSELAQ